MFVNDIAFGQRIGQYKTYQGPILSGILDINKPYIDISADDFLLLFKTLSEKTDTATGEGLDALSIYLAVYGPVTDPDVPEGSAGKFTYIFSGGKQTNDDPVKARDSGFYYNIAPGSGFDPQDSAISQATFGRWRDNWQKTYLPRLPATAKGDTKSVTYIWKDLVGMVGEIVCQAASVVRICLVAYLEDEEFSKQLTTHFMLMDGTANPIPINNGCRPKKLLGGDGLDTGSPCPPAGNCP
jgi:hypothetical protein